MNLPRDNVFAGAAFAGEQDGRIARRRLPRGFQQSHHRCAARLQQRQIVHGLAQSAIFRLQTLQLERALDDELDLLQRKRLGDVVVGAALHRGDGALHRRIRRHQDDEDIGMNAPRFLEQLQPVHLGHAEVGQHQVVARFRQHRARVRAIFRLADLMPQGVEEPYQAEPDIFFVVDD